MARVNEVHGGDGLSVSVSFSQAHQLDVKADSLRPVLLLAFPATYLAGSAFPPSLILLLYPRFSPPPPDKDSKRGKALMSDVERELHNLHITHEMRDKVWRDKSKEGWYETSERSRCFSLNDRS